MTVSRMRIWGELGCLVIALTILAAVPGDAWADDVTPPGPPTGVFVTQGTSWRAESQFDLWWATPQGQESPIAAAHYELCPAVPLGPCTTHEVSGADVSEIHLNLPYAGWFWLRVWLEDEAGNVNPNVKSGQVMLRFDDAVPPGASLRADEEWLGADTANSPECIVEIGFGENWPVSGIRGYSLTEDGSVPDDEVEVYADQDYDRFQARYTATDLAEGVTSVRSRSVSNSGVPSSEVATSLLRVDRTSPTVTASGIPLLEGWSRAELAIAIGAQDQSHLSGMVPAEDGESVEDGGHVAYELDGAPTVRIAGDRADVDVAADGVHELIYRAFDAAGNESVEKEAVFRIDRTAPVGSFRALNPADPRGLRVDVADATSGIADGWIEYRRVGDGGFRRLATILDGGVLAARLDDTDLPTGRYELRAVVHDVAGNEAIVDSWANGSPTTLTMPLRLTAKLDVAGQVKVKRCAKPQKSRRRGKGKRKLAHKRKCRTIAKPAKSLVLAHGKRAESTGTLTTAQGTPIANAPLVVEGQPRSGRTYTRIGAAATDARGRFRFTVPAGPSRTVRYRYDGTDTVRPATGDIVTKVKAAARLKVDRRRVRNGRSVRFSGRLLGKPIPSAGKLVALQAKVGRGWRTFATPRANAKGRFRHRYRFTATTGVRRYAFRVVVAREAAYPYEKGMSRTVEVTVRGR